MRIIKLAVISFVLIFLLVTAMSLLIPSRVRISRAINLEAPRDSVLQWVRDTARWKLWHPAFAADQLPHGGGEVHITPVVQSDSLLTMALSQADKKTILNGWQVYQYPGLDSVTLQWYMDFRLPWYPWQKFGALFYEDIYGTMMERGLQNLKNRVERQPA